MRRSNALAAQPNSPRPASTMPFDCNYSTPRAQRWREFRRELRRDVFTSACFRPAVITAFVTAALAPSSARAQTRTFDVCVLGRFQTCSSLQLSTSASASVPGGTDLVVSVRQTTLSTRATGLTAFSFLFPTQPGFDPVPPIPLLGTINGGITPVEVPTQWRYQGQSGRLDVFHEAVSPGLPAARTQFLGGCAGGAFAGGLFVTSLVTCTPGIAYGFAFTTQALFSATDVSGFGLELYAGTDEDAENGRTVSCSFTSVAPSTDEDGSCIDFADLADPFVAFAAPTTTVPEPGTVLLVACGLLALAGARCTSHKPTAHPN